MAASTEKLNLMFNFKAYFLEGCEIYVLRTSYAHEILNALRIPSTIDSVDYSSFSDSSLHIYA